MTTRWPIVRHFAQLKDAKGEDFYSVGQDEVWPTDFPPEAGVPFSFFAIFDGHGGDQVGAHLKEHMLKNVITIMDELARDAADFFVAWTTHLPKVSQLTSHDISSLTPALLFPTRPLSAPASKPIAT